MATIAELQEALSEGRNLIMAYGKPAILTGIDLHRPANPVSYQSFTGTRYKGPADRVAVIGRVDLKALSEAHGVPSNPEGGADLPGLPMTMKDGTVINPGDRIRLLNGEEAIFEGLNLRRPKKPVSIELRGRKFKCGKEMVSARLSSTEGTPRAS